MSLDSRWREIARANSQRLAVHQAASGRSWTFGELERLADADPVPSGQRIVHPSGRDVGFLRDLLRAWRAGVPVCPLELGQTPPQFDPPAPGIALLKLTSGSTGSPRGVALTPAQVEADVEDRKSTV